MVNFLYSSCQTPISSIIRAFGNWTIATFYQKYKDSDSDWSEIKSFSDIEMFLTKQRHLYLGFIDRGAPALAKMIYNEELNFETNLSEILCIFV